MDGGDDGWSGDALLDDEWAGDDAFDLTGGDLFEAPVDLALDPAATSDPEPGDPPTVEASRAFEVDAEISLDLPADEPLHVDVATLSSDVLADAFGVAPGAWAEVASRLDLDDALDGHSAAVLLGELGVDASVEHGDMDGLAAAVASGQDVRLSSTTGALAVTAVDVRLGTVEISDPGSGSTSQVDLRAFEAAWEQASYAMVVAEPSAAADEVVLSTGPVTVLGLTWPAS